MKNNVFCLISCILLSSISYGNTENHNVHFHPVEEIYVDELPESIMDIKFIHSISKLPVVFRGAAKNWEAMNWTPESLEARGLDGIVDAMNRSPDNPKRIGYELCIDFSGDKRSTTGRNYNSQLLEILKDVHYYEPNNLKDIVAINPDIGLKYNYWLDRLGTYTYYILAGNKGFQMPHFHNHSTVLLAEFYGERIVFLAEPYTERKLLDNELSNEMNRVIEEYYNEPDSLSSISHGNYSPFQQVILKPGDILYIPSGWYHKIHYLTPCLGISQFIQINNMNSKLELY